jgi:hypothetical protein
VFYQCILGPRACSAQTAKDASGRVEEDVSGTRNKTANQPIKARAICVDSGSVLKETRGLNMTGRRGWKMVCLSAASTSHPDPSALPQRD